MKLNFNFKIKDLDGKVIEKADANKLLADMISGLNRGNSMKLFDWASKLWNGKHLEIDDTDARVLRELIDTSDKIVILVKAPLLDLIDKELNSKK